MSTNAARLLVVDDDPDMLRLLSMRLSSVGYQVTAVTSAETALTQLEIEHPQLVLSDVRLYLYPYVAVNALYCARSLLGLVLRFGGPAPATLADRAETP